MVNTGSTGSSATNHAVLAACGVIIASAAFIVWQHRQHLLAITQENNKKNRDVGENALEGHKQHASRPRDIAVDQSTQHAAILSRYPWSTYSSMPNGIQEAMELAVLEELVPHMDGRVAARGLCREICAVLLHTNGGVKANLLQCWESGSFQPFLSDESLLAIIKDYVEQPASESSLAVRIDSGSILEPSASYYVNSPERISSPLPREQQNDNNEPALRPRRLRENTRAFPRLPRRTKTIQLDKQNIYGGTFYDIKGDLWQIYYSEKHETRIAEWLSASENSSTHNDISKKRIQGTAEWMLNTQTFRDWRTNPYRRLLWCPGIPGVGKTVVASLVIDHLRRFRIEQTPVVFIYYSYQLQGKQDLHFTLGCLSRQLHEICRANNIHSSFEGLYVQHMEHRSRPSLRQLEDALSATIKQFSRFYIVLDGLDEYIEPYSDNAVRVLLQTILSLGDQVKLLVTSRVIGQMENIFQDFDASKQVIEARNEDLSTYLQHRLAKTDFPFEISEELVQQVVLQVQGAAKGRFIMAELHMNSLGSQITAGDIKDTLDNLPDEVDKTYAKAMEQITALSDSRKELAMKTFLWLTRCRRPLTLSELQHALALKSGRKNILDYIPSPSAITSACLGLVVIEDQKVTFVHFTAQEYFIAVHSEWFPHQDVAKHCLDYILLPHFREVAHEHLSGSCQMRDLEQAYPLYQYAATNWGYHYRSGGCDQAVVEEAISLIEAGDMALELSFVSILHSMGWPYTTPRTTGTDMFLFLHHHFPAAFQVALARMTSYPVTSGDRTAFHFAAMLGELEALDNMLERWKSLSKFRHHSISHPYVASPSSSSGEITHPPTVDHPQNGIDDAATATRPQQPFDINLQTEKGHTILWFAAWGGHAPIVDFLLQQPNIDVNLRGPGAMTPLGIAVYRGHIEISQMLIQSPGIDTSIASGMPKFATPLMTAIEHGHSTVVEALLQCHTDINALQGNGRTLLSWAVESGHVSSIELLLAQPGIAINLFDANGNTPLGVATSRGQEDVVRILLKQPEIDVNLSNPKYLNGGVPIQSACFLGHESVVRLFLDHHATDVNKEVHDGSYSATPLLLAAAGGQTDTVKLLLAHPRIQLSQKLSTGGTQGEAAIMYCMDSEDPDAMIPIFSLLVETGQAKLNTRSLHGLTPLAVAAELGCEAIFNMLIDLGTTDVNNVDDDGDFALLAAAQNGYPNIVARLLSDPLIDVNLQNATGRTALSVASQHQMIGEGKEKSESQAAAVVQLLLSRDDIDVNLADAEGKRPVDYALESGFTEVAQMLREKGATVGPITAQQQRVS